MREIFFDSLKPFPSGHHENLKNKNASTSNAKIQIHTTREREREDLFTRDEVAKERW